MSATSFPNTTVERTYDVDASAHSTPSRRAIWAGRIVSAIPVLFLGFDASLKLFRSQQAVEVTTQLGYPASVLLGLGIVEAVCLFLYLVPRTAVLGAVLWTGYLGGAIATHVRVGNPLFSHVLFPIYVAAFLWTGLALRDERVRALVASLVTSKR